MTIWPNMLPLFLLPYISNDIFGSWRSLNIIYLLLACLFICGCPLLLTPVGSYLWSNLAFRFLIYLAVWSKIWPSGFLFFWPSGFGRLDKFGLRTQLELETLKHTSFLASSWLKNKQFETKNLCTHAPTIEYKFDRLLCILPTLLLP